MADFETSFEPLSRIEALYANHPMDGGGETWRGIARNYWPKWKGWVRVDQAKEQAANVRELNALLSADAELDYWVREFYRENFWNPIRGDDIASQAIADELFEESVNFSHQRPVSWLQAALNVMNRREELYPDIEADGAMGAHTLDSINRYLRNDPAAHLLKLMNVAQGHHYFQSAVKDQNKEEFLRGWLKRVEISTTHEGETMSDPERKPNLTSRRGQGGLLFTIGGVLEYLEVIPQGTTASLAPTLMMWGGALWAAYGAVEAKQPLSLRPL